MTRTCKKCGTVAFAVTLDFAKAEVNKFNRYYATLSDKEKQMFGNKPVTLELYMRCTTCGANYNEFRLSNKGDCPIGVTMSPIVYIKHGATK